MTSLIQLANCGELPDVQIMDNQTCDWIRQNNPKILINQKDNDVFLKLLDGWEMVKDYAPRKEWFLDNEKMISIHGIKHLCRCQIYAYVIAKFLNINQDDLINILIATGVHDIRRIDDHDDILHSDRSADWFKVNYKKFDIINPKKIDNISDSIKFHNKPFPLKIIETDYTYLKVVKIADALDRFRLPKLKWWPDKKIMNFGLIDPLLSFSYKLVYLSETKFLESNIDIYDCVYLSIKEIINDNKKE